MHRTVILAKHAVFACLMFLLALSPAAAQNNPVPFVNQPMVPTALAPGPPAGRVALAGGATIAAPATATGQPSGTRIVERYGKLPLSFERNEGQTSPGVKFLSRGAASTLCLTASEAVLQLQKPGARGRESEARHGSRKPNLETRRSPSFVRSRGKTVDDRPQTTDSVLRIRLVNANSTAIVTGTDELPGKANYFIGNDPQKWRTNVPTYAKVKFQNVYPGVDLVYYGNQSGQLEYDFVVAPGGVAQANVLGEDITPEAALTGSRTGPQ